MLTGLVNADPTLVRQAVDRLVDLALAWESTGGLRPLSGVAEGLTGGPDAGVSGLRPCSVPAPTARRGRRAGWPSSPSRPGRCSSTSWPPVARRPPTTPGTPLLPEDAATPAEELLARRLLVPRGTGSVVVPGEVGLALRGGHTTLERVDDVPALASTERSERQVDATAAGAAFEAVRRLELLLDLWGAEPPSALRSGGLGVRDLKATAAALHVDEATMALLVETAMAAGLLATAADAVGNPVWLPTDLVDTWVLQPPAERWAGLARTWLDSPRMPGLVGSRDTAGKPWNALAPELAGSHMAETRAMTLAALATLPDGGCLAAGTGVPSVVTLLRRQRPRRPRSRADQVLWTVTEAAALGVTGLDGLASYARDLLAGDDEKAQKALAGLLPEPVDHVLLQADLTAVAPGPLESQLARRLQLVADVESRGGATVYRFTPGSVRRALDTGWTAIELHDFLGSVSRTPVPQPLTYLVDDTARTFGSVRVGHAEAFLRADDETALTELLHHPKASALGLRRLAPTVLVSSAAARPAAASAARARRRTCRRGGGRQRARGPPRPAPGANPARAPRARGGVRAAYGHRRRRRHRDPLRRPRRVVPPDGARGGALGVRVARRAARRGGERHAGADRLRRQQRHPQRARRRPGLGRGRRADRPRPALRRRPHLRRAPDHGCKTHFGLNP